MALIFPGETSCALCGGVIEAGTATVSFPAFLPATHELGKFSDAAFHLACFERSTERQAVQTLYDRWRAIWDSRPTHLRTLEEIEAWGRQAFERFP